MNKSNPSDAQQTYTNWKESTKYGLEEGDDVAYITLPNHPGKGVSGCVKRTIKLADILKDYKGPDLLLDFDSEDFLIGIEILE